MGKRNMSPSLEGFFEFPTCFVLELFSPLNLKCPHSPIAVRIISTLTWVSLYHLTI